MRVRSKLLGLLGAGVVILAGTAMAVNRVEHAVNAGSVSTAKFPMPPGGLHGAPMPPTSSAAQQRATQTEKNAWSDPENDTQPKSANPFPATKQTTPQHHATK